MLKAVKLWLPVLVWAAFIFFLSGIPNLKSGFKYDFFLRKMAHMTEYFILTFLLWRAFQGSFQLSSLQSLAYPAVLAVSYAMTDEFHQTFIAGRHGSLRDVLIDSIGVLAFFLVLQALKQLPSQNL